MPVLVSDAMPEYGNCSNRLDYLIRRKGYDTHMHGEVNDDPSRVSLEEVDVITKNES